MKESNKEVLPNLSINWYPGHMVKAKRLIIDNLKLVDIIIELVDSRIPLSSRNPDIDSIIGNKPKIIVFNKSDLADKTINEQWKKYFESKGNSVVMTDSISGKGLKQITIIAKEILKSKIEFEISKGRRERPIRAMILGIPNVGKSTLINKLVGKSSAKTGNKPGVTRGKQWIRIGNDLELLDMPGILWPKFEGKVGIKLAVTGAIRDEIIDIVEISLELLKYLSDLYPDKLKERYKLDNLECDNYLELLERIGRKRGTLVSGGEVDHYRIAQIILDEFKNGKIGSISLERVEDISF